MTPAYTRQKLALDQVRFPGFMFFIRGDFTLDALPCYLQGGFMATCSETGKQLPQLTRMWMLSDKMTPSEIVQTALKCVLTALEHEAREKFTYMDVAVFGPHFDVDDLAAICSERRNRRPA